MLRPNHSRRTLSFIRIVRAFAGASLVVLALPVALLLLGLPVVVTVRMLYEGLSWIIRLAGGDSALADAFVHLTSAAGAVVSAIGLMKLLGRFFEWRHKYRARFAAGGQRPEPVDLPVTAAA